MIKKLLIPTILLLNVLVPVHAHYRYCGNVATCYSGKCQMINGDYKLFSLQRDEVSEARNGSYHLVNTKLVKYKTSHRTKTRKEIECIYQYDSDPTHRFDFMTPEAIDRYDIPYQWKINHTYEEVRLASPYDYEYVCKAPKVCPVEDMAT